MRLIAGHTDTLGYHSLQSSSASSSSLRGIVGGSGNGSSDSKRGSLISTKSTGSDYGSECSSASSTLLSSGQRFLRGLAFSSSVSSKTSSLERLHGKTGGGTDPTMLGVGGEDESEACFYTGSPLALISPFKRFVHTLYIYPRSLNFAVKHNFGRVSSAIKLFEGNSSSNSHNLFSFN